MLNDPDVVLDVRDIQCPYCEEYIEKKVTRMWDFRDGEQHTLKCKSCKKVFEVQIDRPLRFIVAEKGSL